MLRRHTAETIIYFAVSSKAGLFKSSELVSFVFHFSYIRIAFAYHKRGWERARTYAANKTVQQLLISLKYETKFHFSLEYVFAFLPCSANLQHFPSTRQQKKTYKKERKLVGTN